MRILRDAFALLPPEFKINSFILKKIRHIEPGCVHCAVLIPDPDFPSVREIGQSGQQIAVDLIHDHLRKRTAAVGILRTIVLADQHDVLGIRHP